MLDNSYLLGSPLSRRLYHEVAEDLPIIDYHNHLNAADVLADRSYDNISQLWISVDPYKHRAMRILGVPERYITGDASDYEKFETWYACLPRLAGNALYDWSVMEFERVFDMALAPFTRSAKQVWEAVNGTLRTLRTGTILSKFNIEYSAPCAGLTDDLSPFRSTPSLAPSLRGDAVVTPDAAFIQKLSELTARPIRNLPEYVDAVDARLRAFAQAGCRYTDHALDDGFRYVPDDGRSEERFRRILAGEVLPEQEMDTFRSCVLKMLGGVYAGQRLNMQLHIGAKRTTSTRLRAIAGPAGGYAAIGNCVHVKSLTDLLDAMEQNPSGLPKTILFTLNPADNAVMSVLAGSYSKDGVPAIVSQGPAWWWCDHYQGMRDMLDHCSAFGVLSTFIGMTTDSRSILSFVRHEYFRRILCQWIADKTALGILPDDFEILSGLVRNICYLNAKQTLAN